MLYGRGESEGVAVEGLEGVSAVDEAVDVDGLGILSVVGLGQADAALLGVSDNECELTRDFVVVIYIKRYSGSDVFTL